MKILISTGIGMLMTLTLLAQIPQSFNYQAILRDDVGEIIAKQTVEISLDILQSSVNGTAVYTEVHTAQTNAFGLINLQIGQGTSTDEFTDIDWSKGPYFIKVGLNGVEMGTTQLLSVPYALYAELAGNVFSGSYNDLTDIPANLDPSNNFSGSFKDLSDIPETLDTDSTNDFSGDYNDLINKPRIPSPTQQVFTKNDSVAFINDKKVGIGTEKARGRLEVFQGGVVFAGDSGTVNLTGEGTRLMWIPEKAAFRAGKVSEDQWDLNAIGNYSVALGLNSVANTDASTALGGFTLASGFNAVALGYSTKAREYAATAMGNNTEASGNSSVAMGFHTQALAERSTAMGDATKASGSAATAMGLQTEASETASTSIGNLTKASGFASFATGSNTEANGSNSIAMGISTLTSGDGAIATGLNSQATGFVSTAIGFSSIARKNWSIALGHIAKSNHEGAIVIAANTNGFASDSIASSANEQMVLRADGNFFFCNDKVAVCYFQDIPEGRPAYTNRSFPIETDFSSYIGLPIQLLLSDNPV